MLLKQLDNWVRRTVNEKQLVIGERRSGEERRQLEDRRKHMRFGMGTKGRRSEVDRRSEPVSRAVAQS